jgi:hypothetical protein
LQLDHLPCFDDPPFRFSDASFKLRTSDLSFRQLNTPRLKVSPQLRDNALRIAHRRLERVCGQLKIDHLRLTHWFEFATSSKQG